MPPRRRSNRIQNLSNTMDNNETLVTGHLECIQSDCPNAIPRIDLKGTQVTMGRGIGNSVIWESLQISRRHAVMEYRNQTWRIKDTSTNGMLVNDRRIPQNQFLDLHDSDVISFVPTGALKYRFVKVNSVKHSPQNLSLNASPANVVTSSSSHRPKPDSSVSVIVTNPAGKSPKRKSGPNDLLNSERKRKRLFLNTSQQAEKHSDEEDEELLDIDELPSFFEKTPIHSSTPMAKNINNNENGHDVIAVAEGNDLETVKLQLKKCQQRLREVESKGKSRDDSMLKEITRLKVELATSHSESRVFQEELYKKLMEVLEHEFSCCICNEVFIQATVIDCGHTFCGHCISEWVKRKMECPNCRKPVKLQVKHVEMENFITKLHTMFSEEIKTKRVQILDERKREVESIAAASEAARNASRARPRAAVPDFEQRFDFYADLNNLREMLVPRGIHPPNFIPQGPLGARPFAHNILNFQFPEFMRAQPAADPQPPPPLNPRRRSQRINHPREPPGPRIRGRGAQQVPEVPRPHIAEYVLGAGGPMDILTVD